MIRTATVTDVTETGVWVVSSWLTAPTGPLAAFGSPKSGDAVLVVRTDDGEMVAVSSRPAVLPTSSVDNSVARFDGTGGALQGSGVTIDDSNRLYLTTPTGYAYIEMDSPDDDAYISLDGANPSNKIIMFKAGGSTRFTEWVSGADQNWFIQRHDDSGNPVSNPLGIVRSNGRVQLGDAGATAGLEFGNSGPRDMAGSGSPEGVVSAPVGSTWRRTNGGAGTTFWVKESGGTGNTGWVAK